MLSASCQGYRTGGSVLQQLDDVKVGYDNDADGDIADAGDDMPPLTRRVLRSKTARRGEPGLRPPRRVKGPVLDDFSSSVMSLSYDNTLDCAAHRQGQASNLTLDTPHAAPRRRSPDDRQPALAAARQGLTDDRVLRYVYDGWNP